MTSFVIRTEDEDDLGFLLFAAHDGDWPPAGEIGCVFSGFPLDPALLDDPRGRLVMDHKGREWVAQVSYSDREMLIRLDLPDARFDLRSDADGNRWRAVRGGQTLVGTGTFI